MSMQMWWYSYVHHDSNTDWYTNAYDNCLEENQHQSNDEEHLLLRDMEIEDKQVYCTQYDAIFADLDINYDSQANDSVCFSNENCPPSGAVFQKMCEIICKQCKVLCEAMLNSYIKFNLLLFQKKHLHKMMKKSYFIRVCLIMVP